MTPSPAAIAYLTEINETIGAQWALRLAREMRAGVIVSVDGEAVMAEAKSQANPPREGESNRQEKLI